MVSVIKKLDKPVKKKFLTYGVGGILLSSFGLVLVGEYETMMAWWLVIILLMPPLLWALKTPYVALKTITIISFVTQFVTVPFFYLNRDTFAFGNVKPFHFTAWEAFPMLAKVSIFLFALVLFFKLLYPISWLGGTPSKVTNSNTQNIASKDRLNKYSDFDIRKNRNPLFFVSIIILMLAVLAPLNLWLYSKGIGLTGVESYRLPYRLSGILFYLTKYVTPLILGYLYSKTKRDWPLMMLFLAYAWELGLCSISKGAVIMVMFPVIIFAWLDHRKIMFTFVSLVALLGVSFASEARNYVYFVESGTSGADTSFSILTLLAKVFNSSDSKIWDLDFIPLLISGILSRIEGFGNLVMAQFYDPDAVDGAWSFILRMIWRNLAPFDVDLHSIQWQGYTLPIGFYNGGALLSNAVIVGNTSLWWVVISAMVTALILVILEKSTKRLFQIYKLHAYITTVVIGFFSMLYFAETGGSVTFVFPFLLIFILSWLPPLFHLDDNQ